MRHQPWETDGRGLYASPSEEKRRSTYHIAGEAFAESLRYFEACGGDTGGLLEALNRHVLSAEFSITREALLDPDRAYSYEYYFYFQLFCKKLIGRYDWHFGEGSNEQLSPNHKLWEKGFIDRVPWGVDAQGKEVHDVATIPLLTDLLYYERTISPDLGEFFSMINAVLPEGYVMSRQFCENELTWVSAELTDYCLEFFKVLSNDWSFIERAPFFMAMKSKNLKVAGFLETIKGGFGPQAFNYVLSKVIDAYDIGIKASLTKFIMTISLKNDFDRKQYAQYIAGTIGNGIQVTIGGFKGILAKVFNLKNLHVTTLFNGDLENPIFTLIFGGFVLKLDFMIKTFLSAAASAACALLLFRLGFMTPAASGIFTFVVAGLLSTVTILVGINRRAAVEISENTEVLMEKMANLQRLTGELFREKDALEIRVRERTEELVKANEKLRELDLQKTDFFANMAHELRTPLTLLISPLRDIRSGRYGSTLSKNHKLFDTMIRNGSRILKMIGNVLDFTKMEKGKVAPRKEYVDVAAAARIFVAQAEAAASSKGLTLRLICTPRKIIAPVDQALFETAFFNVLSNAIKFTKRGGISVDVVRSARFVTVSMRDTGIGIPPQMQPFIFERYYQGSRKSSTKHEGTGIGLAITREILALHGGTIDFESVENQGSLFRMRFPLGDGRTEGATVKDITPAIREEFSPARAHAELQGKDGGPKRKKLLIVEDNADLQDYLSSLLGPKYQLEKAADGIQGLARLRDDARRPALIISDIMMPEMDGYQFYDEIRKDPDLANVPFLFLTAKADPVDRLKGLRQGAVDYIHKPFSGDELAAKVANIIENNESAARRSGASMKKKILAVLDAGESGQRAHLSCSAEMSEELGLTTREKKVLYSC